MTLFYVVRHAAHTLQDKVMVGRTRGVPLSPEGRVQAQRTAARFAGVALRAVIASPRRRARETAAAIVQATGAPCEIADGLDEIDVGEWTGRTLDELHQDARWHRWNAHRGASRCPGGESMQDVLARVTGVFHALHRRWPGEAVAVVSHAEAIRVAVLLASGQSFDDYHAVEIAPAGLTMLAWQGGTLRLAESAEYLAA